MTRSSPKGYGEAGPPLLRAMTGKVAIAIAIARAVPTQSSFKWFHAAAGVARMLM